MQVVQRSQKQTAKERVVLFASVTNIIGMYRTTAGAEQVGLIETRRVDTGACEQRQHERDTVALDSYKAGMESQASAAK